MVNPTKPHITLTSKAVWCCADAYLDRSGRSPKQAYDRWLMASLREAAAVENLCAPAAIEPKKRGRSRKELMPMGWYAAELAKKATQTDSQPAAKSKVKSPAKRDPISPVATPKKAKPVELTKSSSSVPAPLLRQPGSAVPKKAGKPITIKSAPTVAAIEQPSYHPSVVRQSPTSTRREYSPPAELLRNMDRATAVQKPLISISTGERITS